MENKISTGLDERGIAIYQMIDTTPFVSDLQKEFYKTMILERKTKIIDYSYDKPMKTEKQIAKN